MAVIDRECQRRAPGCQLQPHVSLTREVKQEPGLPPLQQEKAKQGHAEQEEGPQGSGGEQPGSGGGSKETRY